jgi:hypothetical protein
MRLILIAPLVLVACAAAPPAMVPRPPSDVAVVVVSQGSSEWGYTSTEVYANDLVISIRSEGVGQPVQETATTVPGAYARVAGVVRRDGPAAVRASGRDPSICPGSQDAVAANPPLGSFAVLSAPCGGNTAPFAALASAALGAIAAPD